MSPIEVTIKYGDISQKVMVDPGMAEMHPDGPKKYVLSECRVMFTDFFKQVFGEGYDRGE
jgi:hypothetical protein